MTGRDPKRSLQKASDGRSATAYWLRCGTAEVALRSEWVLIGRSASCDLVLEDTAVSREHARISAQQDGVVIEDLSTNGVFVDGVRIGGRQKLSPGAMITIGHHVLHLVVAGEIRSSPPPTMPEPLESFDAVTKPGVRNMKEPSRSGARPAARVSTTETDALELLGGVAERLLADGHADAAERLMTPRMIAILRDAQSTRRISPETSLAAARLAIKLATATAKQSWVEYAFEISTVAPRALPAEIVDELYTLIRRLPPIRLEVLRAYIAALNDAVGRLTPSDRFVLQRLRGLAKLALTLGHA